MQTIFVMLVFVGSSLVASNEYTSEKECERHSRVISRVIAYATGAGAHWSCIPTEVNWIES